MNDQDRKALKPCPWCGQSGNPARGLAEEGWAIACTCGAEGPPANTPDEAIAAWNRRALDLAAPERNTTRQDLVVLADVALRELNRIHEMLDDAIAKCELAKAESAVPAGFALVPVEPTEAMIEAMRTNDDWPSLLSEEARAIYAAMLAATEGKRREDAFMKVAERLAAEGISPYDTFDPESSERIHAVKCRCGDYVQFSVPDAKPAADGATEAPVAFAEHMDLKLRAKDLCERLSALVQALWVMSGVVDFEHNGVSVSQIVADLHAAETASEMMAALTGESSSAALAAARKGE